MPMEVTLYFKSVSGPLRPLLVAASLLVPNGVELTKAFGQGQTVDQHPDKQVIDRTLRVYMDAFMRGDISALAQHCTSPLIVFGGQGLRVLAGVADIEAFYAGILRDLRERGYSHSLWSELHVKLLGQTAALVSGISVRYRLDGSELATTGLTFLLGRVD